MKALRINFAARSPARTLAHTSASTWSLMILAVLALSVAGFNAQQLLRSHTIQQTQMQAALVLQQRRAIPPPQPKLVTLPAPQIAAINHAVEQLNLPWRDLFDAIESATPPQIALLALEPDARKHILKGSAEARDSDTMIAYIDALQQHAFFNAVVLTRHEINEQDPRKPLRFQFEAQWQDGVP